jgi:acyl carrier protein
MRKIKKRTWTAETINTNNIKRQLQEIIADVLNREPEEILEENTLYALGAGSLDAVEIFTIIERIFGIYLEDFLETLTKPIIWLINLVMSCLLEQEHA